MSKDYKIHLLQINWASLCKFLLEISQTSSHYIKPKLTGARNTGNLPELKFFLNPSFDFLCEYPREELQLLLDQPICTTHNMKYKMLHIQDAGSKTFLMPYNEKGLAPGVENLLLKQILVRFEEKTPSEQDVILEYLYMNWQDLEQDSSVIEALQETKFVTTADGNLYKPKDLLDPGDTLLTSAFSGEVQKFPGERFVSDGWLYILRKTGLRNTGDPDIILECARRVEFMGSESLKHVGLVDDNKQDFSDTTEVSLEIWSLSQTLIKVIFENLTLLYDHNFCNIFGKIACIPAEKGFPFEPGKKSVKRVLCSYSEAVLLKDWPLAWKAAPILSSESMVPPENSWGALQLRSPPPFTVVIKHLQSKQLRTESCLHGIEEAVYEVLKYLDTIWSTLSSSDVSKLFEVAFIPVANTAFFARCISLFSVLPINLCPLAFELPLRYRPFVKILKQLGLQERLSISSAMVILSSFQKSCRHHRLNPNELRAVIEILHFLCNETIERKDSDRSNWKSNLVVPNDACILVHPNSCVYIDSYGSHYLEHIDSSKLRFVHRDVTERLCLAFGIRKLSDAVVEEPDHLLEPLQTLKEIGSVSLTVIRLKLLSRPFQDAVSNVVSKFSRITSRSKYPDFPTLQRSLESVAERLQFVRRIYTRFWLIPEGLDITRASREYFIPEPESGSSHRTLYYVDRSNTCMLISEPPSYVPVLDLVAIVVSHVLGSLVPLPISSLFICPLYSEPGIVNILRHSSDESEMDGEGSGTGFLGRDILLQDAMQVNLNPRRPFYKGEIVAWQGHDGGKLKYGKILEDVRPSAAQALYRFNLETFPEKTETIISSNVFSFRNFSIVSKFSTHMMPEDGVCVQQPDGSGRARLGIQIQSTKELGHGCVPAELFVRAIEEMLSGAGIRIDTEKEYLIQINLSLKERLKESQAALVLEKEKAEMITKEANTAEEALLCGICLTNGIDITTVPCGHVLCHRCSSDVSHCPFCRVQLSTTIKLYRS